MPIDPAALAASLARLVLYNDRNYADPGNPFGMANYGHRLNFPAALADFVTVANAVPEQVAGIEATATAAQASANAAATSATQAATSATAAQTAQSAAVAAAAAAAMVSGATGTSTTALTLSAGVKSLTTQTGLDFVPGMSVALASSGDPGNRRMGGLVTAYNPLPGPCKSSLLTTTLSALALMPTGTSAHRDGGGATGSRAAAARFWSRATAFPRQRRARCWILPARA
ncbi:hypothetical protein [Elstera litoralis]|uniref:hypothetical protein n=1 Tax=Elstera litoralis TaxID=552518 RepID=UPI0012EE26D1|nr:hypothetical protein [Elstera litoralis]